MALRELELYHGAVLAQIVRTKEPSLRLVERDETQHGRGMYVVSAGNKEYLIYVKHASKVKKGQKRGPSWCQFTFSERDAKGLEKNWKRGQEKKLLLCLVCGKEHICTLEGGEVDALRLLEIRKPSAVRVEWTAKSCLWVRRGEFEVRHKVARDRLRKYRWG